MNKKTSPFLLLLLLLASGGCYKNEPVPSADFVYSGSNEFKVPCTVQFSNQSAQAYSYDWWFGSDSSIITTDPPGSTLKDPAHVYTKPGTFSVTLRAYTESRKEWASVIKTIVIR
jgi:PKD repeat protein